MALAKISDTDRQIIFECLTACAKGPFFCDADLPILFGINRSEFLEIVARIPWLDNSDPSIHRIIGHTLNDLINYPIKHADRWSEWVSVGPDAVAQVAQRWQTLQPPIEFVSLEVYGPVSLGDKIYRVVVYRIRGGGNGMGSEIWNGRKWLFVLDGPSCKEIMAANPTPRDELTRLGVDCATLPGNYNPLSVEGAVAESNLLATPTT